LVPSNSSSCCSDFVGIVVVFVIVVIFVGVVVVVVVVLALAFQRPGCWYTDTTIGSSCCCSCISLL